MTSDQAMTKQEPSGAGTTITLLIGTWSASEKCLEIFPQLQLIQVSGAFMTTGIVA